MIYLASPYTANLVGEAKLALEKERFQRALAFTTLLMQQGLPVFSPITYCHPIALVAKLPGDAGYWWDFNIQFLRRADAIFVLRLPGWDQSKGMQAELKQAKLMNIPRVDYTKDFEEVKG